MRPAELAVMDVREFTVLMGGLSAEARFPAVLDKVPRRAQTPDAIASAFGSYLG